MFEKIRIRNFKSVKDSGDMHLSNLNIIVGPNNIGKSSILYALLLLKQSIEAKGTNVPLVTSGPLVDLGSYIDFINNHKFNKKLIFIFKIKPPKIQGTKEDDLEMFSEYNLQFAFNRKNNEIIIDKSSFKNHRGKILFKTVRIMNKLKIQGFPRKLSKYLRIDTNSIVPNINPITRRPPRGGKLLNKAIKYITSSLRNGAFLNQVMGNVRYVAPIRVRIPRYGVLGDIPSNLEPSGAKLLRFLSSQKNKKIIKKLNYWLDKKFKIVHDLEIEDIDKSKTIKSLVAKTVRKGPAINLSSMGCGISQIVPIIIQTLNLPKGGCLIVEQPEIHLHPKAQADLADLFIQSSKENKQFIIETHSEHFILRIRRRIAESKIDPSKVKLFFMQRKGEGIEIEQCSFKDNGHFEKWPKGFFEEGYKEAASILKASNT